MNSAEELQRNLHQVVAGVKTGHDMAGLAAQPRNGDHRDSEHLVDDGDPPQIPIMVPTSGGQLGPSTGEAMEEIPAVVSITRVPAKPKQQEVPPGGGLKVRTDLGELYQLSSLKDSQEDSLDISTVGSSTNILTTLFVLHLTLSKLELHLMLPQLELHLMLPQLELHLILQH